jgi:hypothetical protein
MNTPRKMGDSDVIRAIRGNAMALDLYAWLNHLDRPAELGWARLRERFGQKIADSRNFEKAMRDVLAIYPEVKVEDVFGGIRISPSHQTHD